MFNFSYNSSVACATWCIYFKEQSKHTTDALKTSIFMEPINNRRCMHYILIHGAVSRVGTTSATKVFKHGQRSLWVPTLNRPFPNGQANAGSWLGTINGFVLLCPIRGQHFFSTFLPKNKLTTDDSGKRFGCYQQDYSKLHWENCFWPITR